MTISRRASLLLMLLWTALPAVAHAQKLSAKEGLDERYTDVVPTSGFVLAGLAIGSLSGNFDPATIALNMPAGLQGKSLCFRLASRDGRYRAWARYAPEHNSASFASLEFLTRFKKELRKLSRADLAPRMIASATCHENSTGTILPVSLSGTDRVDSVVALVNPGDPDARVSARIATLDGRSLTGQWSACEGQHAGPSIVFSQACTLRLVEGPSAPAFLEVAIIELIRGRYVHKYEIYLAVPPRPS